MVGVSFNALVRVIPSLLRVCQSVNGLVLILLYSRVVRVLKERLDVEYQSLQVGRITEGVCGVW